VHHSARCRERWEISPDELTYTFHLRADARWSNGDPLTADDIVAGFRRFLDRSWAARRSTSPSPSSAPRDYLEGRNKDFASVGVKSADSRTVRLDLRFRAPYFLAVLTDSHVVPLHQPSLDKFGGRSQRGTKWTQPAT